MKAVLVAGTHGYHADPAANAREWWWPEGRFAREVLERAGIGVIAPDGRAFAWPTGLDGLDGTHIEWAVAGENLFAYCVPPLAPAHRIPPRELLIVGHSHAGQVAAYAFAYGLKGSLITVGTPVRQDMADVWRRARPNIHRHLHLFSRRDWWQLVGALRDGAIGIQRTFDDPGVRNEEMPKGHGDVLRDPALFPLWTSRGWLAYVTGADAPALFV